MSSGIKVTPEQLSALSGTVQRGAGEIDGALSGLRAQLAPLQGGDWAGAAAAQFVALWEQWQRGARDVNQSLIGISALLGNAGSAYAQAESAIAGSFRQG